MHEARAGLVTPPRDVMNPVAEGCVAAQDSDVLIRSPFAGAAQEPGAALLADMVRGTSLGRHHRG